MQNDLCVRVRVSFAIKCPQGGGTSILKKPEIIPTAAQCNMLGTELEALAQTIHVLRCGVSVHWKICLKSCEHWAIERST